MRVGTALARHRRPFAYQDVDGVRRAVEAEFRVEGDEVRFEIGEYDPAVELVIDPVLSFATVFGGSGHLSMEIGFRWDEVADMAVDAEGSVYVTGISQSFDLPAINSDLRPSIGRPDPFVAKFDPSGSLVFLAYLGACLGERDRAAAAAIDPNGHLVVTGRVPAPCVADFPIRGPADGQRPAGDGTFLAKFDPVGSLVFSTFLGGASAADVAAMAVDSAGDVYVAGTAPADFPFTTRLEPIQGGSGGFVAKFSGEDGSMIWSTLLGGVVEANRIALAGDGTIFTAGFAGRDLPVTPVAPAPISPCEGVVVETDCRQPFVAGLSPDGTTLTFAAFWGGEIRALAADAADRMYLAGVANRLPGETSSDVPITENAFQRTATFDSFGRKAFVAKINPVSSELEFSTFLGGSNQEVAEDIAVDSSGRAYVVGRTNSADFPVRRAPRPAHGGGMCSAFTSGGPLIPCFDIFLAKFTPDGSALEYSTFLGGDRDDQGVAVALGPGGVYVVGRALSPEIPTTVASITPAGSMWVAKIDESRDAPAFTAAGVVNAASLEPGLTPGGIATIFGENLSEAINGVAAASATPLPFRLEDVEVRVNGMTAPLFAATNTDGAGQINFIVPREIERASTAVVEAFRLESGESTPLRSLPVTVPLAPTQPGLFTLDGTLVVAQHADDVSLVTEENPARPGAVVTLYAAGLGPVDGPFLPAESPAPMSPLSTTLIRVATSIGGRQAETIFAGLAPGAVGLYQINVRVPSGLPPGAAEVIVQAGSALSRPARLPVGGNP